MVYVYFVNHMLLTWSRGYRHSTCCYWWDVWQCPQYYSCTTPSSPSNGRWGDCCCIPSVCLQGWALCYTGLCCRVDFTVVLSWWVLIIHTWVIWLQQLFMPYITTIFILIVIGGVFYVTKFPERQFPGWVFVVGSAYILMWLILKYREGEFHWLQSSVVACVHLVQLHSNSSLCYLRLSLPAALWLCGSCDLWTHQSS